MKKHIKRRIVFWSMFAIMIAMLLSLAACSSKKEESPILYEIKYLADIGGYIEGESVQAIEPGGSSLPVTAKAKEGYQFIGWSDGFENTSREESNIDKNIAITAYYRALSRTFTYVYNEATGNTLEQSVTLSFEGVTEASFAIPKKAGYEFSGWYLEPEFLTKAVDCYGNLMLGYGIFDTDLTSEYLYAKWTAASDILEYRILMVFVDEIQATLEETNGAYIDVDNKMSAIERKVCKLIPGQLSKTLNEWFEGLVKFEVDMYFTTETLGTESFSSGNNSGLISYGINAYDIPEVSTIRSEYRSIITTFGMNDYDGLLHSVAGSAGRKYGHSHLESLFRGLLINNISPDILLDLTYSDWERIIGHYLHEFTHTIEKHYEYSAIYEYHKIAGGLQATKLYLLGQYNVNGQLVGIPFSFWQGEVYLYVHYSAIPYGTIISNGIDYGMSMEQKVLYKGDAQEVTAIADWRYRFAMWSDGVTTATRQDKNIFETFTVTAIFEEIE